MDEHGNRIEEQGNRGKDKSRIKCFGCNQMGHYKSERPHNQSGREVIQTVYATTLMTRAIMSCNSINGKHRINPYGYYATTNLQLMCSITKTYRITSEKPKRQL